MGWQWEQNLHDYMRCLIISKILREKKWSCSHRTSETIPIAMAGIYCLGLGFGGKVGSCPQACNLPEPCWGCQIQARCIGQLVTAIPFSIQRNENTTKVLTKCPMTFESKVPVMMLVTNQTVYFQSLVRSLAQCTQSQSGSRS